jgi:hypothetical protein
MKLQEVKIEKVIVEGEHLDMLTEVCQTPQQRHNEMIMERFVHSDYAIADTEKEIEEAYEQIALLAKAFKEKNFGVLIGKRGKLSYSDIREIKRELASIVRGNVLIDGQDVKRGRDGDEKLRLMVLSIKHTLEMLGLGAAAVFAGAATATTAGTGAGAIVGTALTAATGALAVNQAKLIKDLRALNRLLNLIEQFADLKPKVDTSRGRLKRFWDWMQRKTPKEIEDEAEKKVRYAARKAQMKMQKSLRGFPKYIKYYDDEGEEAEYPLVQLFDNL